MHRAWICSGVPSPVVTDLVLDDLRDALAPLILDVLWLSSCYGNPIVGKVQSGVEFSVDMIGVLSVRLVVSTSGYFRYCSELFWMIEWLSVVIELA